MIRAVWHRLTRPPLADLASALVVLDAEIARLGALTRFFLSPRES